MVNHPAPQVQRRTVLSGIAAGGVAIPLVAACGGGASSAPKAKAGETLVKTDDVPVGGGKILPEQNVVVTQPTAGDFKCFSAVCTHEGCQVGQVADGMIICPCHNSEFSIVDGSVKGGPAPKPLPEEKITVANGAITLA